MNEIETHPIHEGIQEWRYQRNYRLQKKLCQEQGQAVWGEGNQALFSSPLLMTAYLDKNYLFLRVNSAFASFFAVEPEAFLGTDFFDWFSSSELPFLRTIFENRQPYTEHGHLYNFDGPPPRQLLADVHWIPAVDSLGEPFLIVQILDKTPVKSLQEEKESMQIQLKRLMQMQAFDEFAGNIAHYFSRTLTIIRSNLDFAGHEASHRVRKHILAAKEAVQCAAKMADQLLHYGGRSEGVQRTEDIQPIVYDTVRLMHETLDSRIHIELKMQDTPVYIQCDSAQIRSVILSLLLNARDAILEILHGTILPERRQDCFHILVEIGTVSFEENRLTTDDLSKHYLRLRIGDNGTGMDYEVQQRIFDPFFTTKATGNSTGLSMSSTYGIIRQHQGWIRVNSRPGKGTTVDVFLPMGNDSRT